MNIGELSSYDKLASRSSFAVLKDSRTEPLSACVRDALHHYFQHLDGHAVKDLYRLVMLEVEQPLLETVLQETGGNQTRAAAILGISRSTLRKKMTDYGLK